MKKKWHRLLDWLGLVTKVKYEADQKELTNLVHEREKELYTIATNPDSYESSVILYRYKFQVDLSTALWEGDYSWLYDQSESFKGIFSNISP